MDALAPGELVATGEDTDPEEVALSSPVRRLRFEACVGGVLERPAAVVVDTSLEERAAPEAAEAALGPQQRRAAAHSKNLVVDSGAATWFAFKLPFVKAQLCPVHTGAQGHEERVAAVSSD